MARGPLKDLETRKQELLTKTQYHKDCIATLEKKIEDLSKPKKRRSKKQEMLDMQHQILKEKIASGAISEEEVKWFNYTEEKQE